MARESSIAPKERINVTFKPATGGAMEEIELPMKVMVVGDFIHRYDERPLTDRKPVAINKNNFNSVMEKQSLSLQLTVPNRLVDDSDSSLSLDLAFKGLRDFEPEGVASQIPELKKLLELREALVSLKGPLGNMPAFKKAIEEALSDKGQRDRIMGELGIAHQARPQLKQAAAASGNTSSTQDNGKNSDEDKQ